MRFEFTKEYEIGIKQIDDEHRQFFAYINEAMDAIDNRQDESTQAALELLKKLTDYAINHLDHEEEYMKSTGDAELAVQQRAHQAFRTRIAEFTAKRDSLTVKDLGEIFIFMAKWLRDHIMTTDMLIGKVTTRGKFKMTSEFITGIGFIDMEHAGLFEIIGRVHDVINDDMLHDRYDAIVDILSELREYTVNHFSDEEKYMERIGYSGLEAQREVHSAFIDKLVELDMSDLTEIDSNQMEYLADLVEYLNDWLITHIMKMDKLIPHE